MSVKCLIELCTGGKKPKLVTSILSDNKTLVSSVQIYKAFRLALLSA
jgi:hypothetical protein